jgi:hypothetical protein
MTHGGPDSVRYASSNLDMGGVESNKGQAPHRAPTVSANRKTSTELKVKPIHTPARSRRTGGR